MVTANTTLVNLSPGRDSTFGGGKLGSLEKAADLGDEHLVTLVAQGAPKASEAYNVLVLRYEQSVRSLLRTLCKNPAQADELAQEAFLRGWQNICQLRDKQKFGAWVKRLAYRLFLHGYRRQTIETRYLRGVESAEQSSICHEEAAGLALSEELKHLLSHCHADEAELMILVYGFGFTVEELAQEKSMPVGTIKSHLSRAKQRIRRALEAQKTLEESDAR